MGRLLIFNFDGTSNEPESATQEVSRHGAVEDDNITNVLKFHLLCQGTLKEAGPNKKAKQLSFYYNGVGTYGNVFQRLFNSAVSSNKLDVKTILTSAMKDFKGTYKKGDRVILVGFSRGAALARRFAANLNKAEKNCEVVEVVFDTVAAMGLPNLSTTDRPHSEVVFEDGHTLPPNVVKALHMVSLDDKRKAFQPTLMNAEPRVTEVWFSGAHSDVGGGYYYDGLADISFRFMLDWVGDLPSTVNSAWAVKTIPANQVDYKNLVDKDAGYSVSEDDVSIDPDALGQNHEQERNALLGWATLTDRRLCVIKNDRIDPELVPTVFHTVARRIARNRNYRPQSLKGVSHQILYDNGETVEFKNAVAHREQGPAVGRTLRTYNGKDVKVGPGKKVGEAMAVAFAHELYNPTRVYLEQGAKYKISVEKGAKWRDGNLLVDADGWNRDDIKVWKEFIIKGTEPFRRVPKADWFELIGCIGESDEHCFRLGKGKTITAPASGELCLFANDLKRFYGNNHGKLRVTIRRL